MPSEGFSARVLLDEITPFNEGLLAKVKNLRPILSAVGEELVSITQRAFRDESLRISPWAPKSDGSPATLIKSGMLRLSIRVLDLNENSVTVGADRIYAAIQQLGGTIVPKDKKMLAFRVGGIKVFAKKVTIPARPFFPIDAAGNLSPLAQEKIAAVFNDALLIHG